MEILGLQVFDMGLGFMGALILANLFPKVAAVGGWAVSLAKAGWAKIRG